MSVASCLALPDSTLTAMAMQAELFLLTLAAAYCKELQLVWLWAQVEPELEQSLEQQCQYSSS